MAVIDNLVSYWSLDEASGNALDAKGTNTLTDHNTVGSTTGVVSGARSFGSPKYFSHADNADLSLGTDTPFSFAFWAKSPSDSSSCGLITKAVSGPDSSAGYVLWIDTSPGWLEFVVGNGSSSAVVSGDTNFTFVNPPFDVWHFVVAWHDPSGDTINFQIDDGTVRTTSWSGGTQDEGGEFQLGNFSSWTFPWKGSMDEVGFWKKALSATERTWLYNSGSGRSYADIVAEAGGGPAPLWAQSVM